MLPITTHPWGGSWRRWGTIPPASDGNPLLPFLLRTPTRGSQTFTSAVAGGSSLRVEAAPWDQEIQRKSISTFAKFGGLDGGG